ncbi:hypothetical protein GUJ93_ZPchr0002g24634 [Zizania palustris]|uniref:Uncharacterized protein n=1 Tax=Zizania palustris TaxID=103762 RepID=A0A8J5S0E5_ZIZPA|nr:hypothetical protein GUJ93_ZPchr0002g24634 [Zizania palustris]
MGIAPVDSSSDGKVWSGAVVARAIGRYDFIQAIAQDRPKGWGSGATAPASTFRFCISSIVLFYNCKVHIAVVSCYVQHCRSQTLGSD